MLNRNQIIAHLYNFILLFLITSFLLYILWETRTKVTSTIIIKTLMGFVHRPHIFFDLLEKKSGSAFRDMH